MSPWVPTPDGEAAGTLTTGLKRRTVSAAGPALLKTVVICASISETFLKNGDN